MEHLSYIHHISDSWSYIILSDPLNVKEQVDLKREILKILIFLEKTFTTPSDDFV